MQGLYSERPRKKKSSSKKSRRKSLPADYYDYADPYSAPAYGDYDRRAPPHAPVDDYGDRGRAPAYHTPAQHWPREEYDANPYAHEPSPWQAEDRPRRRPSRPRADYHGDGAAGYYDEIRRAPAPERPSVFGDVPPEGSFEDHYYQKYGGRPRRRKERPPSPDREQPRALEFPPPQAPAPAPVPPREPVREPMREPMREPVREEPPHPRAAGPQQDVVVDQLRGDLMALHKQMLDMEYMHNNSIVPLHAELNALRAQVDRAHVLLERAKAPQGEIPLHTYGTTSRLVPSTVRRSRRHDAPSEDGEVDGVEGNRLPWPGSNANNAHSNANSTAAPSPSKHHSHSEFPQYAAPQSFVPEHRGPRVVHTESRSNYIDPDIPPHLHPELGPVTVEERHYFVMPPDAPHQPPPPPPHYERGPFPRPIPMMHDELPPVTVEERRYGPFPMGPPFSPERVFSTPQRSAVVRSRSLPTYEPVYEAYEEPVELHLQPQPMALPHYSGPPLMPEPPELRVIDLEPPALLSSPTFIEPVRLTSSRFRPLDEVVPFVMPAIPPEEVLIEQEVYQQPVVYQQTVSVDPVPEAVTYYIDHDTGEQLTEAEYYARREHRLARREVAAEPASTAATTTTYTTTQQSAAPHPRDLGTQTFYRDPETGEELCEADFAARYPTYFGQLRSGQQGEAVYGETQSLRSTVHTSTWATDEQLGRLGQANTQSFYIDPETGEEITEAEFTRRYAGTYLGSLVGHGETHSEPQVEYYHEHHYQESNAYYEPAITYAEEEEPEPQPQPQRPPVPTPSTISSHTHLEEFFPSPALSLPDRTPLFRTENETPKPEHRPPPKPRAGGYEHVKSRVFEQPKRKQSPPPPRAKAAKPPAKRARPPVAPRAEGVGDTPEPNTTTPQPHPANFVMESEQF